jgi:hypothetical protein
VQSVLQQSDKARFFSGFLVLSRVFLSLGYDLVTPELVDLAVGLVNFFLGVVRMQPGVRDLTDDVRNSSV